MHNIKVCLKSIVLFCFLIVSVIKCNNIRSSRRALPETHINTMQLLRMCFPDELNPVVITVDLIDVVDEILRNETIESSVVVIDKDFSSKAIQKFYPRHPLFLLTSNSIDTLKTILREIKSARIWNVKSLFLIIGMQCQDSASVLKFLWGIEAVTSFFTCQDEPTKKTVVYTFNPFSNYAPKPWEQVEVDKKPGDQWTLYRQIFRNDPKICRNIKFDKSKHLDGFPIKSAMEGSKESVSIGKFPSEIFNYFPPMDFDLIQSLQSVSNCTPVVYTTPVLKKKESGVFFENGTYDLQLPLTISKFIPVSYTDLLSFYDQDGYIILTKKQSTVPVINQIVESCFNVWTFSMSCIILILILIIVYVSNNQNLREAFLDMLALCLDMELMVPLIKLSTKITFFAATLFMLMFNPAFQSYITSLLTKPARQQVDTLEDLYNNKFHVYYDSHIHEELSMTGLWLNDFDKQYLHEDQGMHYYSCKKNFLKNSSTACILSTVRLPNELPNDYHLSKYLYFNEYFGVASRRNWPLKDKLDKAAMNFVETGHANFYEKRSLFKRMLRKKKLIDRIKAREEYDQLDLGFFDFDYIIIPLSIFWTFFVLIIELMVGRFQKWNQKRLQKVKFRRMWARWQIACIVRQMSNLAQTVQNV